MRYYLAKHNGGTGVLPRRRARSFAGARGGTSGGGTAGVNAARMATGLAADVTILEVDLERMRFLDITMENANTLYSSEAHLHDLMATTDLLIGAVLVPGAKAPKLITRAMLQKMKPGSVRGGHRDRSGRLRGNLPADHASRSGVCRGRRNSLLRCEHARGLCAYRYSGVDEYHRTLRRITGRSRLEGACNKQPALLGGVNTRDGKLTIQAVAEAHGLPHTPMFSTEALGSPAGKPVAAVSMTRRHLFAGLGCHSPLPKRFAAMTAFDQ